jgi:hypothetical protein
MYLISYDERTRGLPVHEDGPGEKMSPRYKDKILTYCRVKPSGATSPFVKVKSAVGPIDARAVEIKQVATKRGEKGMIER